MEYKIGDLIASKVNMIFRGYYEITEVTDRGYKVRAVEENGKPSFSDPKYGNYFITKKWANKNTFLKYRKVML